MADEGISNGLPPTGEFVWYREDVVQLWLRRALEDAIEIHGDKAKAFAWDVNCRFKELSRGT